MAQRREVEPLAVSLDEAAEMLSISRRQLESYVRAGLIEKRRLGRRTVILVESLKRFLANNQPTPGEVREERRGKLRAALGIGTQGNGDVN